MTGLGLKDFANRFLTPIGLELRTVGPLSSLQLALQRLSENRPIKVVYDIGAYKGEWSSQIAKHLDKDVEFHLFEPNLVHNHILESKGMHFHNVLLANKCSTLEFFSNGTTGDSIFRENSEHYDEIVPKTMRSHSLDCVVKKSLLPLPDFIKIDTQGTELMILEGAKHAICQTSFLFLELPIVRYNAGAPAFRDYIDCVAELGFAPYGLYDVHNVYGLLVQVDILFVRTSLVIGVRPRAEVQAIKKMLDIPTS